MLPQSSLLDGLQVLIVDSDPDSASLLALIFEQDGVEILVASISQ
jgi:CheY-like chemotaxis protein